MGRGISCEGEAAFKLSLLLLCSLLLLWLVVLLLFVWVRIIQKEVDRVHKDCRISFKLSAGLTTPETEKVSEVETSGISFPLGIFNKRAVNCDAKRSWENISRTFAYATGDQKEDEKIPVLEESPAPAMEGQSTTNVCALVQEPVNPEIVKDSSCIQIIDDSPSVLFLSGEHPGEKEGEKRIFSNMHNSRNLYEKTSPVKKEYSLILIEADHPFLKSDEDWPKDETFEQQCLSVEAEIVEMKEKSVGKRLSESTPNVCQPMINNSANEVNSDEQLPGEITSGASVESIKTGSRHLQDGSMVSRLENEAETLLPTATVAKRKPMPRKRTKRRAKEKRKTEDEPKAPIVHNHEPMQANKQAEDEWKTDTGQDWKIQPDASQDSGGGHGTYQSSVKDGHEKNLLGDFFENDHDNERPDVSVNHFQSRKKREAECEEIYNVIDPPESRQWPTDSPDNEDHSKHDDAATEKKDDGPNITEEVYSNIDNNNDVEPFYVNGHYLKRLLEEGFFQDDSHVYFNADELRRESTTFNDNGAFDNADERPAYINLAELRNV